jgi:hypothetical protein
MLNEIARKLALIGIIFGALAMADVLAPTSVPLLNT